MEALQWLALRAGAVAPKRGTAQSAGYDLAASEVTTLPPHSRTPVGTALALAFGADDFYGRIAPRSSLAKRGIDVAAGVVDADYRGEVLVMLVNTTAEPFEIAAGDRIAQLVLERIYTPEPVQVEALDATARGAGGFGSTGV